MVRDGCGYTPDVNVELPSAASAFRACLAARFGGRLRWARVYGSYARGEATADSDLDIAAVVEELTKAEKVEAIGDAAELGWRMGVRVSALLMHPEEMQRLVDLEARLARDILEEGISL